METREELEILINYHLYWFNSFGNALCYIGHAAWKCH